MREAIFGVGDTLAIKCQGCSTWFEWVVVDSWWNSVPHHHSDKCQRQHAKRRKQKQEEGFFRCPTPFKKTHTTWESGREEARRQAIGQGLLYGAYRCDCGGIHVGNTEFRRIKVSLPHE